MKKRPGFGLFKKFMTSAVAQEDQTKVNYAFEATWRVPLVELIDL